MRPRLTPAIADVRRAVRMSLADLTAALVGVPVALPVAPTVVPPVVPHVGNSGDSVPSADGSVVSRATAAESPEFPTGVAATRVAATGVEVGAPVAGAAGAVMPVAGASGGRLVLVALSGGPDSLALAAATAFEAPRAGFTAGAVIVDHGLQEGSADAAANAKSHAEALGLAPVHVLRVLVGAHGGPEAAARAVRYAALAQVAAESGAVAVLLGHTLDDQAETVLLGIARGSGAASLHGMAPANGLYRRPLLGVRRATTRQFCEDAGLDPWLDPQNNDPRFTRVRARNIVMPMLETELGPGIAEALARTAEQLREDAAALDLFAEEIAEDLAEHSEAGISLPVASLAANPAALRQRLIRLVVSSEFDITLSRAQTLEAARLVTDWHGQGEVHLPGIRVERRGGLLLFSAKNGPGEAPAGME